MGARVEQFRNVKCTRLQRLRFAFLFFLVCIATRKKSFKKLNNHGKWHICVYTRGAPPCSLPPDRKDRGKKFNRGALVRPVEQTSKKQGDARRATADKSIAGGARMHRYRYRHQHMIVHVHTCACVRARALSTSQCVNTPYTRICTKLCVYECWNMWAYVWNAVVDDWIPWWIYRKPHIEDLLWTY